MDLNKVMLIGRVTQDPELRNTANGAAVTSFGLATNLVWTDQSGQKQEKVEFHNLVAWRKLAEICAQYLQKGSKIYAEGRLETSSWDDQSGNKKYRTEVIMDNMIMLDRKNDNAPSAPRQATVAPKESAPSATPQSTEDEISVEDIPF